MYEKFKVHKYYRFQICLQIITFRQEQVKWIYSMLFTFNHQISNYIIFGWKEVLQFSFSFFISNFITFWISWTFLPWIIRYDKKMNMKKNVLLLAWFFSLRFFYFEIFIKKIVGRYTQQAQINSWLTCIF